MDGLTLAKLRKAHTPVNRFNTALELFAASYASISDRQVSLNICPACLSDRHLELEDNSHDLLSHGLCGCCGKIVLVCDTELLRLYRAAGFSNDQIKTDLPLLRQDFPTHAMLSEGDILARIGALDRDSNLLEGED